MPERISSRSPGSFCHPADSHSATNRFVFVYVTHIDVNLSFLYVLLRARGTSRLFGKIISKTQSRGRNAQPVRDRQRSDGNEGGGLRCRRFSALSRPSA